MTVKTELRAMLDGYQRGYESEWDGFQSPNDAVIALRESWLDAIHWRADELWCGPIPFGGVVGRKSEYRWFTKVHGKLSHPMVEAEARAALMSACEEQIRQWFKDQS